MSQNEIIINGTISLVFVIVSFIIGFTIISKYLKVRERRLLYVGIAWMGMSEPWWASSVSFIFYLINNVGLSIRLYLIIGFLFIPIPIIFWLLVLSFFINLKQKYKILAPYVVIMAIFEVLIIYYLIFDVNQLAVMLNPVNIDLKMLLSIYLLLNLGIFIITGFLFAYLSLRTENKITKLKGKFLLLAFVLYLFGAFLEIILDLPLDRLILVGSGLMFYIGFVMPKAIKNRFL